MADQSLYSTHYADPRFQLLVNSVTDYAIYMLDPSGRIATWNPGARRFKGYEAAEIIGEHFSRFFTPEDRAAGFPERGLKAAREEGRFESEGWRVRKDGTRFWAHVIVDPILNDDGSIAGYAKITRDMTEKRAADRALFESEQRFRLLVQGVRDYAIYMLDPQGFVANWNAGAAAIKGYSADEIVGQHFSRFYTEEDRANGEPARALATALNEGKYEREAWRLRKDGTRFFAHVLIDPIRDDQGKLIGFAKVTRDITDKRQAQQELEDARAALFQSQKMQAIGELTGGIAHDFNNLMTVIRGSAELLQRENLPDAKRRRYVQAILDTAERAATLTSHLLAFGRRQSLKPEVIDVNLRLDAFAEVIGRTLGARVEVVLDLAPDIATIEADPTQLETALLNAAINARDAMPEGGRLTLATRSHRDPNGSALVAIEVSDTGAGMPPEVVQRAFEPFFTTKPVGKGTGLGLSQIHGFAAQTGGRAEIDSRAGEGTTIRLLLPASHKERSVGSRSSTGTALPDALSVLLVEDNDQVRDFAEQLLEELGCHVRAVGDADGALIELEDRPFDILLSDVVMPGMSGIELARVVRTRWPRQPVLLASGYSEDIIQGAAAEFDLVRKPYGAETLSAGMAAALARTRESVAAGGAPA